MTILSAALPMLLLAASAAAQTASRAYMLDWLPKPDTPKGLVDTLHDRLTRLVDTLVRYTSPDIPRESRRLVRISVDGKNLCLVTTDTGVHLPRWGKAGFIVYLMEADTNGDGKIDSLDDYLVRIAPAAGGAGKTVGQGKSAVWSPDGKYIAIVRGGPIAVVNLAGGTLSPGDVPAGQIVMTNSLNPEVARDFWVVDAQSGARTPLPPDLQRKYLWLGVLSPSGARIVYANATRKNLIILETGQTTGHNLVADGALNLDPTWSPDEKQVAYVSTARALNLCGAP